jgi:signal transduction histidine kinase
LRDSVQLTVLQGLSFDALLRELRQIPRRSIVLFANYRQDAHGQLFEPVDIVGTLARASAAPMYVQVSHYIGGGALGGSVIRCDEEGAQTGRLVVRVLRRRPGEAMPPIEPVTKSFVVDSRELRRWDISENRLPPGTELLFRDPTLWERYRAVVLLTLAVVAAQLLLIANLLVERRRRKRAQIVLEEQRRDAEEARLQITRMGRVALLGELTATISHELRQPLAAIRINAQAGAQLLARPPSDLSEASEIFQSIVTDNERAVEMIESIRRLVRKDEPVLTTLDLNQICRDAVRFLQHDAARRKTRLELSLASTAPIVIGDAVQLQQVVLNLVLNGLDAAATSTTDRFVIVRTESYPNYVELLVHDSGPGLPPNLQPHLFESFFSTKKAGLGLGLVIVRSIVERHSGQIRAENHPSGGAVFTARLPTASVDRTPDGSAHTEPPAPTLGEEIVGN